MNIIYQGNIGCAGFTLAQGDIFEANVESIVNSEQSDFVLSSDPRTISGQIKERYGQTVQQELDEATNMEVQRAGTVLGTSGGDVFKRIYHAGFHEPDDWPVESDPSSYPQFIETIGRCLDQVLQMAATEGLASVAFPLIGCGVADLDERMLVRQFLHSLEQFDRRCSGGKSIDVWLVIRDEGQMKSVLNNLIGLLFELRGNMVAISVPRTGIPILDQFASNLGRHSDPNWAKWQMCQFTEFALRVMCFSLGRVTEPALTPESLFYGRKTKAVTFGVVRNHAVNSSASSPEKLKRVWGAAFFARVMNSDDSIRALESINSERNGLAHGRKNLPVGGVEELMLRGLQLKNWEEIFQTDGELRLADWSPWVVEYSSGNGRTGIFEALQGSAYRYLVPETGEVFDLIRKTGPLG